MHQSWYTYICSLGSWTERSWIQSPGNIVDFSHARCLQHQFISSFKVARFIIEILWTWSLNIHHHLHFHVLLDARPWSTTMTCQTLAWLLSSTTRRWACCCARCTQCWIIRRTIWSKRSSLSTTILRSVSWCGLIWIEATFIFIPRHNMFIIIAGGKLDRLGKAKLTFQLWTIVTVNWT